jgi:polysaccharide pyruvyl transferase WcaK-like protein
MVRASKKIGLLDHLGGGNLGDDATLAAVMQNIKTRWPDAEIFGFSMNPGDTQTRHGIPSYPIRKETWTPGFAAQDTKLIFKEKVKAAASKHGQLFKILKAIYAVVYRKPINLLQELFFLAKSLRIIRSFDLLIIAGGGQLLDSWGGSWGFPYTLFKWVFLAKLSRVKCYFINVGAGPLENPLSKYFVKQALLLADYTSFRDAQSRNLTQEIGFVRSSPVSPDSVYGLDVSAFNTHGNGKPGASIVGIAPMAYCDPRVYWDKDQAVYDYFIRNLALFGSWLIRSQYSLALFSTDIWFDAQTIEDLKLTLSNCIDPACSQRIKHEPILTIEQLFTQISSMDYVVTCRFHGVIFAHLLNKPVLALSHHHKVAALMQDIGLSEYCVDIRNFDLDLLTAKFKSLVSNSDRVKRLLAETQVCYKQALRVQFDGLFSRELR